MRRVPGHGHRGGRAVVTGVSLLVGLAAGCSDLTAPTPLSLVNIDVGVPSGWTLVGTNSPRYVLGTDPHSHSGHLALAMGSNDTSSAQFTGVGQLVLADAYRGKRVRLSAWVRQDSIVGSDVGLWMRVDGSDVVYAFDNFSTRSLSGTAEWHQVSVILDVPTDAVGLAFGALMSGSGEYLVDDMVLGVVSATGPTTDLFTSPQNWPTSDYSSAPKSPTNLDFEK